MLLANRRLYSIPVPGTASMVGGRRPGTWRLRFCFIGVDPG